MRFLGVLLFIAVQLIDTPISGSAYGFSNVLKALSQEQNKHAFVSLSASQIEAIHKETPEMIIYNDIAEGISYGYWRLRDVQYFRIVALNALTTKHKAILSAIDRYVLLGVDLVFSIKSVGGEHVFFESLSKKLREINAGTAAKTTALLLPNDFCASACVGTIASLNKVGRVVAFQDQSASQCPTSSVQVHAASYPLPIPFLDKIRIIDNEQTRQYNLKSGINSEWYSKKIKYFSKLEYTNFLPSDLEGSGIVSEVTNDLTEFSKTPLLPLDYMTITRPDNFESKSIVETFFESYQTHATEYLPEFTDTSRENLFVTVSTKASTYLCESLLPSRINLRQWIETHAELYSKITKIVDSIPKKDREIQRVDLSWATSTTTSSVSR
jgi:hypothetical protein